MRRVVAATCLALLLAPLASAANGPGALVQNTKGWRWSRGAYAFDLVSRGAAWTAAEADLMRLALDHLPDVMLEKVKETGTKTFYRDPRPVGLTGPRGANVIATTVIEKRYVSFGDALFAGLNPDRVYFTTIHELGHVTQYAMIGGHRYWAKFKGKVFGTSDWTKISWTMALTGGLRSWNGFVSDYARTNDREDFAESLEYYWTNPDELQRVSPAKFRYMRDEVFNGEMSLPTDRVLTHVAIQPVVPALTRLGDTADEQHSLVKCHGERFMGPLDGGFNSVTYGGKKALDLAVSRQTVWSWVPGGAAKGMLKVKVTTQDGASNELDFTVKGKPWWKFW